MSFGFPLGLLALLAMPAVLALHLFRRKRTVRAVSALFLFDTAFLDTEGGSTPKPLRVTWSLLLELLLALLLGLAIAEPRFVRAKPPHLVVVLDGTSSMEAVGAMGASALARARRALADRVRELPGDARVSLVLAAGAEPVIVLGPRAPKALLTEALATVRAAGFGAAGVGTGLDEAIKRGRDLAGEDGRILVVTDAEPRALPPDLAWLAVGEPLPNASIAGVRWGAASGDLEVDILHFGRDATRRLVATSLAGELLAEASVALRDGAPARHRFSGIDAANEVLVIRLDGDALAIDDWALLPPLDRSPLPTWSGLPEAARSALRLDEAFAAIGDVSWVASSTEAVLQIVESGDEPAPRRGVTHVVLGTGDAEPAIGPYLIDPGHPLTFGLSLAGVAWGGGAVRGLPGRPLVDLAEAGLLSVEAESLERGPRVHLAIDVGRQRLTEAADWPVLLANVMDFARAGRVGPEQRSLTAGESAVFRAADPSAVSSCRLLGPEGESLGPPRGDPWAWRVDRPGLYRLVGPDDQELAVYCVRFHAPDESDLRRRGAVDLPAQREPVEVEGGRSIAPWLLLLALFVFLADAYVLARKR